ncbi:amidase signature enzyme [Exidia glandulosa HHB12029]|uniref:Glutamyl-tRNA(Gln) amidotransferase subunit A, mitochondrial n=1 Tax=Exidia glandulosa HHB12029 TaxID=1314781 RepID=A0A165KJP2_EXIGL|nr:amidase signature enzyme [Exidia glandulosa HHB12029]
MRVSTARRAVASTSSAFHNARSANNATVNALISMVAEPSSAATRDIAVKDNICTTEWNTTCSSAMLKNFKSPYDATAVRLLRISGARIVGKTNLDEFGMGSLNIHSIHGHVINPHDVAERRSTGGSSGGSAAAVASGMCFAALGTDTGGSIRLPASYCGIYGLKPSYGLVSRHGVVAYADSLDCVGVLASSAQNIREVFGVICQHDYHDLSSASPGRRARVRDLLQQRFANPFGTSLHGLRVGVPQEYFPAELSPAIAHSTRIVLARMQRLGATIVPMSLPSTPYALSAYYVIASAEASSNLARYDGVRYGTYVPPDATTDVTRAAHIYALTRTQNFGAEVRKRILLGTYALTAEAFDNYFLQAQRVRQRIIDDFDGAFALPNVRRVVEEEDTLLVTSPSVDILVHPSARTLRRDPP